MFIIRNTVTGEESAPFADARRFRWLDGATVRQKIPARPGETRGDERLHEIAVVEVGEGPVIEDSAPVYDAGTDTFSVTRTHSALPPPPGPGEAGYDHEARRRDDYPPVGDQLDAIWKQINQDRLDGKDLVREAHETLNVWLAVKAKWPKTQESNKE